MRWADPTAVIKGRKGRRYDLVGGGYAANSGSPDISSFGFAYRVVSMERARWRSEEPLPKRRLSVQILRGGVVAFS
jgi:hypothetical protein